MRSLRILILISVLLLLIDSGQAADRLFPTPVIKQEERLEYIISPKKEKQYLDQKWGINPMGAVMTIINRVQETPQGKKMVTITEGVDEKMGGQMVVLNEFIITPAGLQQTLFDKQIIDLKTGDLLFHYEVKFDKMGKFFPPNTYTSEVFPLVMRGLDFDNDQEVRFYWWGSERSVVPLYTKIKNPKEITVRAGTFLCYRVETWADLSDFARIGNILLKLVSPFLPVYTNYFTVEPPHHFISFTGPIGPPGSPEVFTELISTLQIKESESN